MDVTPARMTCKSFCARNWADFGLWAVDSRSGNVFWFSVSLRDRLPKDPFCEPSWSNPSWALVLGSFGMPRFAMALLELQCDNSCSVSVTEVVGLWDFSLWRVDWGRGFIPPSPQIQSPPPGKKCWLPASCPPSVSPGCGEPPSVWNLTGFEKAWKLMSKPFLCTGQYWDLLFCPTQKQIP